MRRRPNINNWQVRVLLVDRTHGEVLARALVGHDVRIAMTIEAAVALVAGWSPDLILIDFESPELVELTCRLKTDPRHAGIPIVALATNADRAYAAGCDGYFSPPIDVATLAADLARYHR